MNPAALLALIAELYETTVTLKAENATLREQLNALSAEQQPQEEG